MIAHDEEGLICDLAETYHILDYKSLSPSLIATFFVGLRADSRTKMKLADSTVERHIYLMAMMIDRLSHLIWMQTKDGSKGINHPELLTDLITKTNKPEDIITFESGDAFIKARNRILRGGRSDE